MHTAWWWRGASALIVWGCVISRVLPAWGHADLDPRQSIPNKWETYTLSVPTEPATPTVRVRLVVPSEFEIEMLAHTQAWQIDRKRDERGYIREVTWYGGRIPSQTFEELKLLVRNPTAPGTYLWKIEQGYEDGTSAMWEAQTQIVPPGTAGAQRAEEAWRAAQLATTVSLVALGIAVTLIIVSLLTIIQSGRGRARDASS